MPILTPQHSIRRSAGHCGRIAHSADGFTIIELLTAVAVLAILVAIGIPTFVPIVTKVRMDGEITALSASLSLARSEAAKRGQPVSVCPGTSGACPNVTDWTGGWQIISNSSQLSLNQALGQGDTLTSSVASYPQFTPMGYTFFSGTLSLHDPQNKPALSRCIVFNAGSWKIETGAACP